MSIEITVTKAFMGECIWIRYGKKEKINIIIDSGPSSFKRGFKELINKIKIANEKIDLLILTHIDDDHIKGFERYLVEDNDFSIFKQIMFNCGITIQNSLHSPNSAVKLIDELKNKKIKVLSPIHEGFEMPLGDGNIKLITPIKETVERVETFIEKKTGRSLHSEDIEYTDLDEIIKNDIYKKDTSETNEASIAFVLQYENRKFLFLGDAHCEDILIGLEKYFNDKSMDLIKLSHHGSPYNITEEFIKKTGGNKFIISTNKVIDKATLARVVSSCENSEIYCNYRWWENDEFTKQYYFSENDKQNYFEKQRIKLINLTEENIEILDNKGEMICILKTI